MNLANVLTPVPQSLSAAEGAAIWMQCCTAYGPASMG
jgi:NADPH:quinone reductase-like Zn-dependent oxidoreductase